MATAPKTTFTRSAVGNKAMFRAMNPAIIINPKATQKGVAVENGI